VSDPTKRLPVAMALALLGFNLLTAAWWPVPWTDEALFLDPAANWLFHGHFTSSVWQTQPYGEFWISNAPAYSLLLAGWLQVFGFSLLASRSLNMVLQALLVWILLAWAQRRLNFRPWQLVLLALLLAWPNSAAFMARSGRYDMLACLIATLMVLCLVEGKAARGAVVAAGFVMPWVCLPALAFTTFASLLVGSKSVRWVRLALHLGSAIAGFLALYFFADWKVGGERFLSILHSLWLSPVDAAPHRGILILDNLLGLGADRFWLAMVPLVGAYFFWQRKEISPWKEMNPSLRSWLGSGLFAAAACVLVYKMNILYWWMVGVPLALAFLSSLRGPIDVSRLPLVPVVFFLVLLGLPTRILLGASQAAQVEKNREIIQKALSVMDPNAKSPAVFAGWPFYYEVKKYKIVIIGAKFIGEGVGSDLHPELMILSQGQPAPAEIPINCQVAKSDILPDFFEKLIPVASHLAERVLGPTGKFSPTEIFSTNANKGQP